ncbi:MAG: AAA family ATPase, partial [Gemmatimonadaceae bacterium]
MLLPMRADTRPSSELLPLVGRDSELAALRALLDAAESGSGATLFLAGEGGVGKSRLAAALADEAMRRGWTTAIGRAYPVESGVPYAVFADAMVPVLRALDDSALTLLTRGGSAELAALFPALAPGDGRGRRAVAGDPAELKTRLLWNFAQLLARWSAKQPLLIVLENLQWADSASLELMHFVARQLAPMRVVMLGTYNELERDQSAGLRPTEKSLVSLGAATIWRLMPLSRAATDDLLREAFGVDAAAREFAALLFGWTRGNPFFLEEVLTALVAQGRLYERDGVWHGWDAGDLTLPSSIREALVARASLLSVHGRAVADFAAVIGTRASYDALRSVSELAPEALLAALDELQRAHILSEGEAGSSVVFDFVHPMVRDALYGELGLARVGQLHARVAESL